MKKLLSILFMIVSVQVFAQDNVISAINITLPTNPDAHTANWGTGKSLFVISATGQMTGGRINPILEESRILVIIKQGGNKVCGTYTSNSAPAADFNTVTKVWSGSNAASLLGKDCTLPPGDYEVSVRFFGAGPAGTIPLSDEKTKSFTIQGNEERASQPPQGIMPANGTNFSETDIKKPVTFRWTPVIPKPQDPVTYRLTVWQLIQGQTGAQAIKVNQPIITKDVDNITQAVITNIVDGPCKPPLMCDFVWNVQALDREGKAIGGNNGTSEAFSFSYASASCGSIVADSTIKCNGTDPKTGLPVYAITITLKNLPTSGLSGCNAKFNNVAINSGGGSISASSSLPVTIAPNGTATISFNYTPATAGATSASVILFGNWTDALGNSTNLQVDFGLPKCITCGCSRQWNPLKVQIPGGFKDYDCGGTIVWNCKTPFVFTSSYDCTSSNGRPCDAKISWTVSQSGGGTVQSGSGATGGYTPTANGAYTLSLIAVCNGQKCPLCTYTIIVRDCIHCGCNKQWDQLKVLNATRPVFYNCNSTIPWNCKNPFSFVSSYQCISTSGKPCDAVINWSVSQTGGGIIQTGNTSTGSFTPIANGTYTLTLDAECNGQKCKGCSYTITVNDCIDCGCNKQWSPLKVQNAAGFKYYDCNSTIPWSCKNPFSFVSSYQCTSSSGRPCPATVNWSIALNGTIIQSASSATGTFTPIANGTYIVTLNAECNGKKCDPCVYKIVVGDCINCDCGKWGQLTIHTGTKPLIYNCGNTIPWNCNKPFDFTSFYECGGSNGRPCPADIKWGVSLNGSVIQSGNSASGNFTPTANGSYTFTLNVECGGKKCPPCTYTIVVTDCCSCGGWGSLNVPRAGGLIMQYQCGSSIAIPMSCNQPFNFTSSYQCSPVDKSCQAATSWEITEGTTVLKTGTGTGSIAGSFTPTENGAYTITLYATCGGVKCPACSCKAVVTNCLSCIIPPAGMVGWWPGDNSANDLSGLGNNGTAHGAAGYVTGKVANAFSLANSPDYISVPDNASLNFGTGNFSMDAWVKTSDASNVLNIVDKRTGTSDNPVGYSFFIVSGYIACQIGDGQSTVNFIATSNPVSDGKWHLVAVTVDRSSKTGGKLYVDGVPVFTFDPTSRPGSISSTVNLLIGQRYLSDQTNFRGQIDELEIFKRVLQATEISAIYHADSAGKCKSMTNNSKGQQ